MTDQLSPRQQQILTFITDQQANGFTPSMREIGAAVGLSSTSSVRAQLQNLEESGYIRLTAGKARAIRMAGAQSTGWISVDDRLPQDDAEIIVWIERPEFCGCEIAYIFEGKWISCMRGTPRRILLVNYWQPLPDRPRKSEGH